MPEISGKLSTSEIEALASYLSFIRLRSKTVLCDGEQQASGSHVSTWARSSREILNGELSC
jgi:hypothetical protein